MSLQNIASGAAAGTGNSQVAASGAGSLMNGNQTSLYCKGEMKCWVGIIQ
jgi:hypothetical protein